MELSCHSNDSLDRTVCLTNVQKIRVTMSAIKNNKNFGKNHTKSCWWYGNQNYEITFTAKNGVALCSTSM